MLYKQVSDNRVTEWEQRMRIHEKNKGYLLKNMCDPTCCEKDFQWDCLVIWYSMALDKVCQVQFSYAQHMPKNPWDFLLSFCVFGGTKKKSFANECL